MHWLQQLDTSLFLFINTTLANPVFDWLMPLASDNPVYGPAVTLLAVALLWKGGAKGRLFVLALILAIAVTDPLVVNNLKKLIGRERPFLVLENVRCLLGKGSSGSFPSAHSANWFAAAAVTFLFYRKSWIYMLPMAALVGFSRIYNGVHYPADVAAGALIGAAAGVSTVWLLSTLWGSVGPKWLPVWWSRLPSLTQPARPSGDANAVTSNGEAMARQWFHLGCVLIAFILLARLLYLASGAIDLSEDEAYYWLWSKELALSYYSKPPLVAYTIALSTAIWGDTVFGIRFFSPVIGALIGLLMLRFLSREISSKAAFALVVMTLATPLLGVGSVLMTIDPLSVLFWIAAMLAGWKAIEPEATTRRWLWVGLWMGLGLYTKYVAFLQLLCWLTVFVLIKTSRVHLRRPGPWLALGVQLLFLVPVMIWNHQHDWITVTHVAEGTNATTDWKPTPRFLQDFLLTELGLLNPVFFIGAWIAALGLFRSKPRRPLEIYLFSMGFPMLLFLLAYSLKARINANWIAPAILPLLTLTVVYWGHRWSQTPRWIHRTFQVACAVGFAVVFVLHDTALIKRISGKPLPAKIEPLRRVSGWEDTAHQVREARDRLLLEGRPVFIVGHHYGLASQLSFYLPESREALEAGSRLVFVLAKDHPSNQFYFWPGYSARTGENAIFVRDFSPGREGVRPAPEQLLEEFESVTDLGLVPVRSEGRAIRWLQMFECRGLR